MEIIWEALKRCEWPDPPSDQFNYSLLLVGGVHERKHNTVTESTASDKLSKKLGNAT